MVIGETFTVKVSLKKICGHADVSDTENLRKFWRHSSVIQFM